MLKETETIAYHAARLLILVSSCGKPQGARASALPGITGRTLLAKLDFFLRYPSYLRKAAEILQKDFTNDDFGLRSEAETKTVESRMVRYLYGPWDHVYYPALAYLVGKGLIIVEMERGTEIFRLTILGKDIALQLKTNSEYLDIAKRAKTAYRLFNAYSGSRLKDFIYQHFPEVVNRNIGMQI